MKRNSTHLNKHNLEQLPIIKRPRLNSEVCISETERFFKFSNKYLKQDLNRVKRVKSQIIIMLNNNQDTVKETKKIENEILPNFKRKFSDSSSNEIKLFNNFRYQSKSKNKLEIKFEHPYFIINSRLPDNVLDNQKLMNNIFNKNLSRLNTE